MPTFRRVAQTEQMPNFMEQTFFGQPQIQEDPYAELRAEHARRQASIHRQTVEASSRGYEDFAPERDWTNSNQPARYAQRPTLSNSSDYDRALPADMSRRAIRRADYDTDRGLNTRGNFGQVPDSLNFFVDMLQGDAMIKSGFSIWDPQYDSIREAMEGLAEETGMKNERSRQEEREMRLMNWQRDKSDELRTMRRNRVQSRAPIVMRTSMENVSASRFGQVDYAQLDRQEADRQDRLEAQREARLAIKRKENDRAQRHAEWQEYAGQISRRLQDNHYTWADSFSDQYGQRY